LPFLITAAPRITFVSQSRSAAELAAEFGNDNFGLTEEVAQQQQTEVPNVPVNA
jgi:hypothetical protein